MQLSPSWEAANCAATQELASILWSLKVHYSVHKSPPTGLYPEPDRLFIQRIRPGLRPFVTFLNKLILYGEELLAPVPNWQAWEPPLVGNCLFNMSAACLHTWRLSPPSATWGRAMPWWQGTHPTWILKWPCFKSFRYIQCAVLFHNSSSTEDSHLKHVRDVIIFDLWKGNKLDIFKWWIHIYFNI
jgi:hypothetical protein